MRMATIRWRSFFGNNLRAIERYHQALALCMKAEREDDQSLAIVNSNRYTNVNLQHCILLRGVYTGSVVSFFLS